MKFFRPLLVMVISSLLMVSCGKSRRPKFQVTPVYGAEETEKVKPEDSLDTIEITKGNGEDSPDESDSQPSLEEGDKKSDDTVAEEETPDAQGDDQDSNSLPPSGSSGGWNVPPSSGPIGDTRNPSLPPIDPIPPSLPFEGGPVGPLPPPIEEFPTTGRLFPTLGPIFSICGNGKIEPREQCDDGNLDNKDGCNIVCLLPYCGNGVVEYNEWCDDGNNENGDGCSKVCEYETCGNGILDNASDDSPPTDNGDEEVGILSYGSKSGGKRFNTKKEECDDGNNENGDGCSQFCTKEVCGNGFKDVNEECDDGNNTNGDGCSKYCEIEICGNGRVTPNEGCDDGNHINGDGCSSECEVEAL